MRWAMGLAALLTACGGGNTDTTADSSGLGPDEVPLDLCEANPIPDLDVDALGCAGILNALETQVRDEGAACESDDDCRLTNGFCDIGLTGLPQIAVNRCVEDSLIADMASAYAGCDDDGRSDCARNATVVGVECDDGECVEIVEEQQPL